MFSQQSGLRAGLFELDHALPWELPEGVIYDATLFRKPRREVPLGLVTSLDGQAVTYEESLRLAGGEHKEDITSTVLRLMWSCPGPDLGVVSITVNFKFRGASSAADKWQQLSYSLKESPIRVALVGTGAPKDTANNADLDRTLGKDGICFSFDQEDRHRKFWDFVRDKKWDAVASFLEKRAIAYNGEEVHRRRFRVMNLLAEMFDGCDWLITHSPFVFTAGHTKSVIICDTEFDDDQYAEDDEEEEEEEEGIGGEDNVDQEHIPKPSEMLLQSVDEEDDEEEDGDITSQTPDNSVPRRTKPFADDELSELSGEQFDESTADEDGNPLEDEVGPTGSARTKSSKKQQQLLLKAGRPKTRDLGLKQFIFTQEISGKRFEKLV
jgi:hypothetical protein